MRVIAFVLMCVVLITAAIVDWRHGIVPNRLTLPAILAGIVLASVAGLIETGMAGLIDGLTQSIVALLVGAVPMTVIFFAGGIGGGDVKLVAAVGAICASWQCMISCLFYAFVVAALMAMVLMVRHRIVKRTVARLISALLIVSARLKPAIPTDSPKVPFAVGMCVGGIIAGAQYMLIMPGTWN